MRKKDEISKPQTCLANAYDDEMVFVLLGRDEAASPVIRAWAQRRVALGLNALNDPQILEAYECADQMDAERAGIRGRARREKLDRLRGEYVDAVVRMSTGEGDRTSEFKRMLQECLVAMDAPSTADGQSYVHVRGFDPGPAPEVNAATGPKPASSHPIGGLFETRIAGALSTLGIDPNTFDPTKWERFLARLARIWAEHPAGTVKP